MKTIGFFLLSAICITAIATYGGPDFGIYIYGENPFVSALIFSVILTIVNIIVGTIVRFITAPINFLTLGLFSIVVTFLMIYITDSFYQNIEIKNIIGYISLALIPVVSGLMVGKK